MKRFDPFSYQTNQLAVLRLIAMAWHHGQIDPADWTRHIFTSTDWQRAFWWVATAIEHECFVSDHGKVSLERFRFDLTGEDLRRYIQKLLARENNDGCFLWGMVPFTNSRAVRRLYAKLKDCILNTLRTRYGIIEEQLPREIADQIRFIYAKPTFQELWRTLNKGICLQYREKENGLFVGNALSLQGEKLSFSNFEMEDFFSTIIEDMDIFLTEFRREYINKVFYELLRMNRKLFESCDRDYKNNAYISITKDLLLLHYNVKIDWPWLLDKDYAEAVEEERKILRAWELGGLTFGWLMPIVRLDPAEDRRADRHARYRCRCACGREVVASSDDLKRGRVVSCGHCGKPRTLNFSKMLQGTHAAYDNAKQAEARRGVPCELDSRELFVMRMGLRPDKRAQLHRSGHEDGQDVPYSLDVCVWLDQPENAAKTARRIRLRHPDGGTPFTRKEAAAFFEVTARTIDRYRRAYGDDEALAKLRDDGHPRKPEKCPKSCAQKTPKVDIIIDYKNEPRTVTH